VRQFVIKIAQHYLMHGVTMKFTLTTIAADQQATCCSLRFNRIHEETCNTEEFCVCPDYSVFKILRMNDLIVFELSKLSELKVTGHKLNAILENRGTYSEIFVYFI